MSYYVHELQFFRGFSYSYLDIFFETFNVFSTLLQTKNFQIEIISPTEFPIYYSKGMYTLITAMVATFWSN